MISGLSGIASWVTLILLIGVTVGCGQSRQSALDECADSKGYLWNTNIKDNRYEGNELYWDAIGECEDTHG